MFCPHLPPPPPYVPPSLASEPERGVLAARPATVCGRQVRDAQHADGAGGNFDIILDPIVCFFTDSRLFYKHAYIRLFLWGAPMWVARVRGWQEVVLVVFFSLEGQIGGHMGPAWELGG